MVTSDSWLALVVTECISHGGSGKYTGERTVNTFCSAANGIVAAN